MDNLKQTDNSKQNEKNRNISSSYNIGSVKAASTTSGLVKESGHKLELDPHRSMSMTGVTAVPVFTDKNITVRLEGETLLITGQGLTVKNLDVENGKLSVSGQVFSLKYTSQMAPTSFIKRILK